MEWLSQNWFNIITLIGILFGWAVHYGISTAKWQVMSEKVEEMEVLLKAMQLSFQAHTSNAEIHVSHTLLQLFNERSDYVKQQFTDTRADIERIERLLTTK